VDCVTVYCFTLCFFFFFSSRRRHTRWPRDWSSDVCSSDLPSLTGVARLDNQQHLRTHGAYGFAQDTWRIRPDLTLSAGLRYEYRSEERRVGKEWRYRWGPEESKRKIKRRKHNMDADKQSA